MVVALPLTTHHPLAPCSPQPPPSPPRHELLFFRGRITLCPTAPCLPYPRVMSCFSSGAVLIFCWKPSTSGHTVRENSRRSIRFALSALRVFVTTSPAAENSRPDCAEVAEMTSNLSLEQKVSRSLLPP